jgi:hypothetical protein
MDHVRESLLATTLVVLVSLMVGCGQSSVRLGWVETSLPGHLKATYEEFTGTETSTVSVQSGKTLYLEYDAEVSSGGLHLEIDDPYGETIWCVFLCENCGETKALPLSKAGCYTISVRGEAAEGGFDVKWEQR